MRASGIIKKSFKKDYAMPLNIRITSKQYNYTFKMSFKRTLEITTVNDFLEECHLNGRHSCCVSPMNENQFSKLSLEGLKSFRSSKFVVTFKVSKCHLHFLHGIAFNELDIS